MIPQPPPGQGPIDPRGAFTPPPAPGNVPPPSGWRPPGPPTGMPPGMPPGMMPPPYPFMMPPPRPRGGFMRGIFVTLATTIFSISLMLNIYLLLTSGFFSGNGSHETSLIDGDPREKIAVIPINGVIMDDMSTKFDRWLRSREGF